MDELNRFVLVSIAVTRLSTENLHSRVIPGTDRSLWHLLTERESDFDLQHGTTRK